MDVSHEIMKIILDIADQTCVKHDAVVLKCDGLVMIFSLKGEIVAKFLFYV